MPEKNPKLSIKALFLPEMRDALPNFRFFCLFFIDKQAATLYYMQGMVRAKRAK